MKEFIKERGLNILQYVNKHVHDNDSFMLYKIKHKNKHFAINTKAHITNQIANKLESKLVQELHNNRISNKQD